MTAPDPVCAVVGLGFVGTGSLRLLARAGLRGFGYDVSPAAVARAQANLEGVPGAEGWTLGTDPAVLAEADAVLVAVRLGRDREGAFRDDALRAVAETLDRHGRDGQLVVLESTVQPGTTRRFAQAWLHRPDADVAHAPERLRIGDDDATTLATPRLVGGLSERATERACALLTRIGLRAVPVSAPEVSELAKLLENAFLTTGISLIGEITRLAHAAGVPAREVTEAAATKPHGYFPFHPGPGIGGHCLRNDLDLLRQHAASLGLPTPMLDGIAQVAAELPDLVVARLERLLADSGRQLRNRDVLLVGVGFKVGSPDVTETPAEPIVRRLREAGARVAYADAQVPVFAVDGVPLRRVAAAELARERFAVGVVLAGDRTVGVEALRAACESVLDTGGGTIMGAGFAAGERL